MRFQITPAMKAALAEQAPELAPYLAQMPDRTLEYSGRLFPALVESIVSQQLAVRAAAAIFARVEALLGEITAENLMAADPEKLRQCGLSQRKIEYLRGIALAEREKLDFDSLAARPDAEVIAELTRLKGVGVWTAEMLLIFALGRPDVVSYSDLGIRNGIKLLYGLDTLTEEEFAVYRRRYSPYGTLASLCLWEIKDGGLKRK